MQDPKIQVIIKGKYFKSTSKESHKLNPTVEDFDMVIIQKA
jgi:hypothetical protein